MQKTRTLTLPLLVLSSSLLYAGVALAEDKKTEPAPTTAPAVAPATVAPAPAAPPAQPPVIPDPVAVVNGQAITKAEFDQYAKQLRGRAQVDSVEGAKSLVNQLVIEELLVQEANKQKLADNPEIKQQMDMIQRNLLASTVVRQMLSKSAPSEEAIKKEYDTAVAAMKGKEYKARHILVDSEDKAKEVVAELKKGGDFAALAKTKSTDSSKDNGGDLGWFTPSMMVPPFSEAVAKLEKGKYSETPVQTPFGWHVILLEDIRDATPPSLDELKPQITQMLQSKIVNDYLEKLKTDAKVDVKEITAAEAKAAGAATANEEKAAEKK